MGVTLEEPIRKELRTDIRSISTRQEEINPYVKQIANFTKERLVDIWKIGFCSLKRKRLDSENMLKYKAVCTILKLKYNVDLPRDPK